MNTKELTTTTFATEDALDGDDLTLISITTRPAFAHRMMEWRNDGSYSKAWNLIADKICAKNNDIECTIDDNYLRVFYKTEEERNLIYSTIDEIKDEIEDCFIMAHSDIANISLPIHDEKTGTAGFVSNKDFALVLQGFFTPNDDKILEEKGFAEPSIKEQALWSAYGLFNELDVLVSGDKSNESTVKFVKLLDRFISENGGWEYFDKDENK